MKGRDWYDFIWYVAMKTDINYPLLSSALYQTGSWARQSLEINKPWILSALEQKILAIDWQQAVQDVSRFLKPNEQKSLELWHQDFLCRYCKSYDDNRRRAYSTNGGRTDNTIIAKTTQVK